MADKINWYPAHMKSRYINWVENIGWDWCLSRQRFYGIPFPVWHCNKCKEDYYCHHLINCQLIRKKLPIKAHAQNARAPILLLILM